MEFTVDLGKFRSQKLLLTPQLKQAIEILEMDSRELYQYVVNQLDTNPALEEAADPVDFRHLPKRPTRPNSLKSTYSKAASPGPARCTLPGQEKLRHRRIPYRQHRQQRIHEGGHCRSCSPLGVPESKVLEVLKTQSFERRAFVQETSASACSYNSGSLTGVTGMRKS